ncbi:MAG: glycosyltransferase, partial [Planctomycetes bacterium]|nr:glycosyltransferase [Planctomycetota bacterium]
LEYFLEPEVADVPIDLYGLVEGEDKVEMLRQLLSGVGRVSYRGYVDAKTLQNIRRSYAYSIVMWAPTNEHQLYAAPNKFFDAIADGVPPLTAPHPQCKMLVNRYQCGIVLRDWTFDSFREGAAKALKLVGTPVYAQMVENCRRAVLTELNWEAQFRKIQKCLPERLAA